jgi:hypothetical protein
MRFEFVEFDFHLAFPVTLCFNKEYRKSSRNAECSAIALHQLPDLKKAVRISTNLINFHVLSGTAMQNPYLFNPLNTALGADSLLLPALLLLLLPLGGK